MRQIDAAALQQAETRVLDYLQNIDRADHRKGRMLALAAILAFNILVIITGFVLWMWWTGRV